MLIRRKSVLITHRVEDLQTAVIASYDDPYLFDIKDLDNLLSSFESLGSEQRFSKPLGSALSLALSFRNGMHTA